MAIAFENARHGDFPGAAKASIAFRLAARTPFHPSRFHHSADMGDLLHELDTAGIES